ncbi:hypothetical protein [Amaricoccus tamworthensis]|uniref:hypothetical protein n=1 Tax=Amaricoccus tamworthensis TaxID=57002 RepID=UPI003C7A7413
METSRGRPWFRMVVFLIFAIVAIYTPMIPVAPGGTQITPDAFYCLAMAWIIRDPDAAPFWVIVALALVADVLMFRPPGLMALGMLIVTDMVRHRRAAVRGLGFFSEWLVVSVLYCVMLAGTQAVLKMVFVDVPEIGLSMELAFRTVLLYPVIAAAVALGLRMSKSEKGERSLSGVSGRAW